MDEKKRKNYLEISTDLEDVLSDDKQKETGSLPLYLQFTLDFPFLVKDTEMIQVASLLHFLNQSSQLPGFELNELEEKIRYRYVWIIAPSALNGEQLNNIIGAIALNWKMFSQTIELMAEGEITFNELLSQLSQHSPSPQEVKEE